MASAAEQELRGDWRDRWKYFLERVQQEKESEDLVDNVLRDKITIGNAERKIAGGHEGREILELLQNARDAIWEGDQDSGRVHVDVHDEGVLVANTGSRFDLFDDDVEEAVTMIGKTGKDDEGGENQDDQSIGHKGVGLKSILAAGDSFEIFTRPENDSDDILGVRLSRAYLVNALLTRLGHDVSSGDKARSIGDDQLQQLIDFDPSQRTDSIPIEGKVSEAISELPLFQFPAPLDMDDRSDDHIQERVHELLTGDPENSSDEKFRTAVFIRYEDTEWRNILSEFDVPVPDEDELSIEDRPDRIWNYLSSTADEQGLRPETIVQLGGIHELSLERWHDNDRKTETWRISEESAGEVNTHGLEHDDVEVSITTDNGDGEIHYFDKFSLEGSEHHTTLLLNKTRGGTPPSPDRYPLYLFYPIENTSGAELPFCLHGRFRVETNRKDLSKNSLNENIKVLEEGLDLVELVGKEVAVSQSEPDTPDYSSNLPWTLFPPVPTEEVDEPTTQKDLISWFQSQLYQRLSQTTCIATSKGARTPEDTLLYWDHPVIQGYLGYSNILSHVDRDPDSDERRPLPQTDILNPLVSTLPASWMQRVRHILVSGEGAAVVTKDILDDWALLLDSSLSYESRDNPGLDVPAEDARDLLKGTVTLIVEAVEGDEENSVENLLDELSSKLDGVHLLPCRIRDSGTKDELALVSLEQRRAPTTGERKTRRTRSVIWGVESETQDVERPPTPPRSSKMTVYFLDEEVQDIPNVSHVLGRAGRIWGIREYEGIPSFVRSLLDSFADGGHQTIESLDFVFLSAIVDRLGRESRDLQADEGDFFPVSYLKDAVETSDGEQRANLRRRIQIRRRSLELEEDLTKPISDTVLSDGWQTLREKPKVADDEEDPTEEWKTLDPTQYPSSLWPEPDASTWEDLRDMANVEVTDDDLIRTLGLLGTGTLPNIRVVWMYGDTHPPMRREPHWNPIEWNEEDFADKIPEEIRSLQETLNKVEGYVSAVNGPQYHPQESADHSSKCNVKLERKTEDTNIASWIWIEDTDGYVEHSDAIREVLRRHGGKYTNLLRTGWSCDHQHKRRGWNYPIPSLLNWQLRELPLWDPVVEVDENLMDEWGEQGSKLRFAVKLESERGAQAARMFPHVTEDNDFEDELLNTLGVRPVDELGPAEAAEHLQKIQSVLVDGSLPETGPSRLWIPGERINDWNQAYNHLLQPLLKRLPEDVTEQHSIDWGGLTHLPLKQEENWVTAPIEWIRDNSDQVRYFKDASPKPWEKQAVEEEGHLILSRCSGPFTRLSRYLGVKMVDASKLVFDPEKDDIELATGNFDGVSEFQRELAERRDVLVASTERTDEDEIEDTALTLSRAAEGIEIAESFPQEGVEQLSDPTSALYRYEDDDEALLLNAEECDGGPSLEDLAMGVALLFERPTKVATFREALQPSLDVEELKVRWEKRTFPIDSVERILGSNALKSIEQNLLALNDLLADLGGEPLEKESVLRTLEKNEDSGYVEAVEQWITSGEKPLSFDDENPAEEIEKLVEDINVNLPSELSFVVEGLFTDTPTQWVRRLEDEGLDKDMESAVVEWLVRNRSVFQRPPLTEDVKSEYERFLTVHSLWERTDNAELTEKENWSKRLRELHTTGEVSWTDNIHPEYHDVVNHPPRVMYLSGGNRVDVLVRKLVAEIGEDLDVEFDWGRIVKEYVFDNKLPEPDSSVGARDHQRRAFESLAENLSDSADGVLNPEPSGWESEPASASISASTGGSGGGGGSSQLKGRGQQAEAYVMTNILARLSEWFEDAAEDILSFKKQFRSLEEDQEGTGYQWHLPSVWSDFETLLYDTDGLDRSSINGWRQKLENGQSLEDLDMIRLINVTMEQGPGYDVIDPLGPVTEDNKFGYQFTPVEVKAVDGDQPPYRFRLTTNEYKRAKAFVRDGEIPYVFRVVNVPDTDAPDWPKHTQVVRERVLDTVDAVDEIVDSGRFEQYVKGGYMNMQIE